MSQTVLIAAEGRSDFDTLRLIIDTVSKEVGIDCRCELVFPEYDATSDSCGKGGWSRFKDWISERSGAPKEDPLLSEEDRALWLNSGLLAPTLSSPASWQLIMGLEGALVVLHLDADIVEKIGQDHPRGEFIPGTDVTDYCREALYAWSGLSEDEAVCAIPVQCTETWYLALHTPNECRNKFPDFLSYETTPTSIVYSVLCELGHEQYMDEEGTTTIDKILLPRLHGDRLINNLQHLCIKCPAAEVFVHSLRKKLLNALQ